MKNSVLVKALKLDSTWPLHLMLLPTVALLAVFNYFPMAGIAIAFEDYLPTKGFFGSEWIGLQNFKYLAQMHDVHSVIMNTIVISLMKIMLGMLISVFFAILFNEVRNKAFKNSIQTVIFFPYFISWVILGGLIQDILSIKGGAVNFILGIFGVEPIFFLGNPRWFLIIVTLSHIWKELGFTMIILVAAINNIDPGLYEAATIDGASKLKQIWHITLPSILFMVIVLLVLALGGVLDAGFDQIFNLYNALVYSTGDIIDTYVYRMGIVSAQYSLATAVGLFKSVIGLILVVLSYWAAGKFANYRII